jgi:hypothetical protein
VLHNGGDVLQNYPQGIARLDHKLRSAALVTGGRGPQVFSVGTGVQAACGGVPDESIGPRRKQGTGPGGPVRDYEATAKHDTPSLIRQE